MMNFLYVLLYIVLFIFCLSILIIVHELGHLLVAKFFKVYCMEFSIGFGPKIFTRKGKNAETSFSLRAFPLGGYVSMYGEGGNIPEGVENIDPSRSFTNIKRWKKILILFAGVFNNAVLALILFFISNQCFIQKTVYLNYVSVKENSIAAVANIKEGDYISLKQYSYTTTEGDKEVTKDTNFYVIDQEADITIGSNTFKGYVMLDTSLIQSYSHISYDNFFKVYEKLGDGNANLGKEIKPTTIADKVVFNAVTAKYAYKQYINDEWTIIPNTKPANPEKGIAYWDVVDGKNYIYVYDGSSWNRTTSYPVTRNEPETKNTYDIWCDLEAYKTNHPISLSGKVVDDKIAFEDSGLSLLYEEYWNDFGTSISNTFKDWGNSATIIVRSFASLFTNAETWKDVGGIVAIGVQTSNILQNLGVAKFIYIWGLISVNLAIVNLFPFPGLDGWQILVLVVEGVFRKQIPEKVKNIVSLIGIALLMAFMVLILVKDVIGLF